MKKGILILLGMFMMVSTVEAKNGNELPNRTGVNYSYNNAVNFEERGIEFYIFTNGEFDFNSNYNDSYYDYNGNRIRTERGIHINRDYRGRINRIGNTFVNYDRYGNVTRIGNVFMRYNRGKLTNVGNLKVRYDYWGNPSFYGNVKDNYYHYNGLRINLNIGDVFNYNHSYFTHRDFSRNYSKIREDNRYYYYRANSNAKIGKRSQILRRRKPVTTFKNKKQAKRSNNTYRRPSTINGQKVNVERNSNNNFKRPTNVTTRRATTERSQNKTVNRQPATVTNRKVTSIKRKNSTASRKPIATKKTKVTATKRNVVKRDKDSNRRRN